MLSLLLLMASLMILMIVTVVFHQEGEPWSWEAIPSDSAHFTPDISPLILAAHTDNYEIIKVSLSLGMCLSLYLAILAALTDICVSHDNIMQIMQIMVVLDNILLFQKDPA